MPGRYYTRRRGIRPVVNTIKLEKNLSSTITTTNTRNNIAKAVNAPSNTVVDDCPHGCIIKAIWISLDFCGLAASGVLQKTLCYMMKNPGANLVPPGVFAVGSSNEKKFVFKEWTAMTMRNQDGNPPYHWEGWIKIPKRYQRMGTDDLIELVFGCDTGTGHIYWKSILKYQF